MVRIPGSKTLKTKYDIKNTYDEEMLSVTLESRNIGRAHFSGCRVAFKERR